MLGPDEPRYASIAREMATSGDWITPRLWGEPWFEKPALLYWIAGTGFRLGLGPELSPRLPVALIAVAFLGFFWWILKREFGDRVSWFATTILGTSAAWIGFSQVGVTDLPMSAAFAAAMLLALPWIGRGDTRFLPAAAALLGVAALAKGLVPLALAVPVVLSGRGLRDLLRLRVAGPFLMVAVPWYLLCYLKNGWPFFDEFFMRHHFGRFTSEELSHVRAWWYYLAVLPGLLLPWTPLLPLLAHRSNLKDPRRRFLLAWALFGLLLFSVSVNKLAGYVLPLFPAITVLLALRLSEIKNGRWWLAACAGLLVVFPVAVPMVPDAVAFGLSRAALPPFHWSWLLPVAAVATAWMLDAHGRRTVAMLTIGIGACIGVLFLKFESTVELDRIYSARRLWSEIQPVAATVCVDNINRSWRYGLNYYSVWPLPECSVEMRPVRVVQTSGQPPQLVPAASGRLTADRLALYSHSSAMESRTKP
jgi:4-amino-4-deoxy-L-arabinose transferase-like glycosyltransferase